MAQGLDLGLRRALLVLVLLAAFGFDCLGAETRDQFLAVSDLHFNPMADPALVPDLAGHDPEQWGAILEQSGITGLSGYRSDANWPLLDSSIRAMQAALADPAFMLITGDFLAHGFRQRFDAAMQGHAKADYRAFVAKTFAFIALRLRQRFPTTMILPVIGNNDSDCEDYAIEPNGSFLTQTRPVVANLIGAPAPDSWVAHGSYSVPHPTLARTRIVVADTVFFSPHYQPRCVRPEGDPAGQAFDWLAATLAAAKRAKEKVWLAYHIPPGIDGFISARGSCSNPPASFFREPYDRDFVKLLADYADTITVSFAGHTHMDEFRLIRAGAAYAGLVLMNPAVSPDHAENPALRVYTMRPDGSLADQSTYFLQLDAADRMTRWEREYDFATAWQAQGVTLSGIDPANLGRVFERIGQSPEARRLWVTHYAVSKPGAPAVTDANFLSFYCALGNATAADYQICRCPAGAK